MRISVLLLISLLNVTIGFDTGRRGNGNYRHYQTREQLNPRCEPITIPMCQDLQYNMTIFPNLMNHQKQDDAGLEVHQFYPLVKVRCSPDLQFFLCTMYAPVCTVMDDPIPPCRSLCMSARTGCENLMNKFGFAWPQSLDCDKFPESGLCVGENKTRSEDAPKPPLSGSGGPQVPRISPDEEPRHGPNYLLPRIHDLDHFNFTCPSKLVVSNAADFYNVHINGQTMKGCALPCGQMFVSGFNRQFIKVWIGVLAMICAGSTLFTFLTFLIDTNRFQYPERPIIYLSMCYFVIAVTYIVGFVLGERASCNDEATRPYSGSPLHYEKGEGDGPGRISNVVEVITQGSRHAGCTVLAVLLYYFMFAANVWWVILTFNWFLAAGRKWGQEAIEGAAHYFHLFAWAVPALFTIAVLATRNIDGDVLSGVCGIGNWNPFILKVFIIGPLCVCLSLGVIFCAVGFTSMIKIRRFMKQNDANCRAEKLEKLMMKISLFAVFYNVPVITVVACYWYEAIMYDSWMINWYSEHCMDPNDELGFNGRMLGCPPKGVPPEFLVFLIKYLMILAVGISSSFWIWSAKTLASWSHCYGRCCHRNRYHDHHLIPTHPHQNM